MPAYHYIALNKAGNELSGVIEAADETAGRQNLNRMELSVVSLNTIDAAATIKTPSLPNRTTYEFEAIDRKNKKVIGTIASENPMLAFGRLFEEYQLNVNAIWPKDAPEQEKQAAKKAGIAEIQKKYQSLYAKPDEKFSEQMRSLTDQSQRKELMEKVNFTMKRVQDFLNQFKADLKIEERDAIQSYLNLLLRIKDSTNLDHIRSTCERMLDHIQRKELFIHEEQKRMESAKLKIETKELLTKFKRTGLQQEISITSITNSLKANPYLKPIANFLLKFHTPASPEIKSLRGEIKMANRHIFSYLKMLVSAKADVLQREAWESIKTMREEKKRLKLKLHALKMEEKKARTLSAPKSAFSEHAGNILGWLLSFYLIAYAISYPFTIKNFNLAYVPKSFYFYQAKLTSILTIFLFIAYSAIKISDFWFKDRRGLKYFLYPAATVGFLLIVINLM